VPLGVSVGKYLAVKERKNIHQMAMRESEEWRGTK